MNRPVAIIVLCGFAFLTACTFPPPLGKELPRDFVEGSATFSERVHARFPIGSSEKEMVQELKRERFRIAQSPFWSGRPEEYQFVANHGGNIGLICELNWRVLWRSEEGRIIKLFADYGPTCF